MAYYKRKDRITLAYNANVKRARTEGAIIPNQLMNEVLGDLTEQFYEAVNKGDLISIDLDNEEWEAQLKRTLMRRFNLVEAPRAPALKK